MMIIPLWDPVAAAAEIERTAALGAKSIAFSENPTKLGLPSIHTDYWDPVFQACDDTGSVVSMHVGSSSNLIRTSEDMPTLAFMAYSAAANQAGTLLDWLFSGNFVKYPELEDRAVGGLDRLDPLLPRAGRAGRRQAAVLGLALRHQHERRARARRGRRARRRFDLDTDIRAAVPRSRLRHVHRGPGRHPAARHHR